MIPTKQHLEEAIATVTPFVHQTPIVTSSSLNEIVGAQLYFKCENFQKMGAFKMRGAVHAIQNLSHAQKKAGVVTHSSGNFGQAVALAARILKVQAYVVMPENAPLVKKEGVKSYGAQITECESTLAAREATAAAIQLKTGATFLHPSNNIDVILGNATAGAELLQKHADLDFLLTPVGGGGLIAGTALATHYLSGNCKTIGGEPFAVDDAYRSLQSGKIETNQTTQTVADGLRTNLGDLNFPIIQELVSEIIRVEEDEIIHGMKLIWERMKIVVEPSSAVPFAAALREKDHFRNKKIGIILSGGNVDVSNLPF
ncbi:pyridoxal-phosphate dependent enzyme [Rasiella rasia]|uniref:Pyridoxal-phosphate dependent enzyme n=1 Tax=Rasiella rasia TaxID=2744027 RepID=A0A6G6GL85_9FLAO|nr:pyridoxal-phosphate dependent enzyme [Rasiella rasia]QIE59250.1 pyridoxal-phosphate dependent enzyme [Rasiella rasia]